MYKLLLSLFFLLTVYSSPAQVFWSEDFGQTAPGVCDQRNVANGWTTSNGIWRVIDLGVNEAFANQWYISAAEAGLANNSCNVGGCWSDPTYVDRTLHVGTTAGAPNVICPQGDCGALYDPGGAPPNNQVTTDRRAESPTINCSNKTSIQLTFNYFMNGETSQDYATVDYFDGTSWSVLDNPPTTFNCGTASAWTRRLVSLPATADNNPNVKIGFRWVNDNAGGGINPAFAVDSIQLINVPPPSSSDFIASDSTPCVGDCIGFTALTSGASAWSWTFVGGTPGTATGQTPTNICYSTPGVYSVVMIAYSGSGNDTVVKTSYINVTACVPPVADFSASDTVFCERSCVDFTDRSLNTPTTWTWQFPGAFPVVASNLQNPTGICYPSAGQYDVLLIIENAFGIDSLRKSFYLNVESCPLPVADFSASTQTACSNQCINFSDLSTFTDSTTTWQWYFPGAVVDTSSAQNPSCVSYEQDGFYDVLLIVTNQYGSDTIIRYSYIQIESVPTAFTGPDTSMFFGNTYQLTAGGGTTYSWSPAEGLSATDIADPIASPTVTTTYTCSISDGAGCTATRQVTVTILHSNNFYIPTAFSPNGDGRNDILYLRGNNFRKFRFSVFDRWGEKMFETEDASIGWNGTHKGKDVVTGVYTWVVTIVYDDTNSLTETGTTTLLR